MDYRVIWIVLFGLISIFMEPQSRIFDIIGGFAIGIAVILFVKGGKDE